MVQVVGVFGQKKPRKMDPDKLLRKIEREERRKNRKYKLLILPSVYYTPETRLAGGLSAFAVFKTNKKDTVHAKASKIIGAAIYTAEDQIILSAPYTIFLNQDRFLLKGQLGFFRYPFKYSGIGNNHSVKYAEDYNAYFSRVRIRAMQRIHPKIYAGGQFWYQNMTITEIKRGGLLDINNVSGAKGGVTSGLGLAFNLDTRDYQLSPTKGWLWDLSSLHNQSFTGSDFSYDSYQSDLRRYQPLLKKHVLAFQLYSEFHFGNPPFNQMALLGGQFRLRGYREGVYRDKKMIQSQLEFRSRVYFDFLSFVAFGGVGTVGNQLNNLGKEFHVAGGGGLRLWLDTKNRIFIRLDYGIGNQSNGFYVNLGQAF